MITHLSEALKEGLSVDIRKLGVTQQMERIITDAVWAPPVHGGMFSFHTYTTTALASKLVKI